MIIKWAMNPLDTTFELTDADRERLKLAIQIEQLEECLSHIHWKLKDGDRFDLEEARKWSQYEHWCEEDSWVGKRTELLFKHAIAELEHGIHCGDCTCVPASCSKCWAEELMGVNTIKDCGKHSLYKIDGAFGKTKGTSIHEAIENLRNYNPTANWEGWEAHAPRWKAEAAKALIWLEAYRDEHFPKSEDQ